MLQAAAYVVCAYLTGMRDSELQAMRAGCHSVSKSADGIVERHRIKSVTYKARDRSGEEAEWITIAPVATCDRDCRAPHSVTAQGPRHRHHLANSFYGGRGTCRTARLPGAPEQRAIVSAFVSLRSQCRDLSIDFAFKLEEQAIEIPQADDPAADSDQRESESTGPELSSRRMRMRATAPRHPAGTPKPQW